jgi:hypothetical protein
MAFHVYTGAGAPTSTPTNLGDHYIDTTNKKSYMAVGTASSADWTLAESTTLGPELEAIKAAGGSAAGRVPYYTGPGTASVAVFTTAGRNLVAGIDVNAQKTTLGLNNVQNLDQTNPANITQSASYRFVTDTEKNTWNGKENAIVVGTTAQYLRGDKTWQTLDKTAVGLSNVQNVDQTNPANITQSASYRFVTDTEKTTWNGKENAIAAGTTGQYLRGDKTWQTLDKTAVGLNNVDNTSDVNKPVSTLQQTAINNAQSAAVTSANGYTDGKVAALVNSAPGLLDTLDEIAAALGDDPNFATTITTQLAGKAPLVHTHVIADTTGLQTALDGKAAVSHTHVINDVTGLQTALNGKEPTITGGTSGQVWTGIKTWVILNASYISDFAAQALAAAKTNLAVTPPPLQNLTDASWQGNSQEFARANHSHGFNSTGVIPGAYGDSLTVPTITMNSQGQVTAASETAIPDATTSTHGLMTAADKTKLDGAALWLVIRTGSDYTSTSAVSFTTISDWDSVLQAGVSYTFKALLRYTTSATNNGIVGQMIGTAGGDFSFYASAPTSTTAANFRTWRTLNSAVTFTSAAFASPGVNILEITGFFDCTSTGSLQLQFRCENAGATIVVKEKSLMEVLWV